MDDWDIKYLQLFLRVVYMNEWKREYLIGDEWPLKFVVLRVKKFSKVNEHKVIAIAWSSFFQLVSLETHG